MPTNIRLTDTWPSFGLAFVGGYGDAAGFVLAKTFTGHVTGNLVLGAIACSRLAGHARTSLGHCHFFDRGSRECAYRPPLQGVAIGAVSSYRHGNRSDSDSSGFFGAGIRCGPWSYKYL